MGGELDFHSLWRRQPDDAATCPDAQRQAGSSQPQAQTMSPLPEEPALTVRLALTAGETWALGLRGPTLPRPGRASNQPRHPSRPRYTNTRSLFIFI